VGRVTENCTAQLFGSWMGATSPGVPADGSPTVIPRPEVRNATRKSSAAPAVPVDASTARGPVYVGRSVRDRTVSAGGPYHVITESAIRQARNAARYSGVFQRVARNGLSSRRARI